MNFNRIYFCLLIAQAFMACSEAQPPRLIVGAEQTDKYLPQLLGKRVAVVTNHSGLVKETHLVDTLRALGVDIEKVLAPEHGFRGDRSDGILITDGKDTQTGLPVVSIYGKTKKPTPAMLHDVEVVVFDIQDVGARFFTYISTLHYVMEACAENNKPLIVLDRPNPNGMYIDGPVLDTAYRSFVGMHPIPVVHGLTVGELARMINGQGWLEKGVQCDLTIIPVKHYTHARSYHLPVKPSPNLPNALAVRLYPSLALFEGTDVSVGRGTYQPFLQFGHPSFEGVFSHSFTPSSIPGMSKYPPHEGEVCYGQSLENIVFEPHFTLDYLLLVYRDFEKKDEFFKPYFNTLLGQQNTMKQIEEGLSAEEIRSTWQKDLESYKRMRKKYLLYDDFE